MLIVFCLAMLVLILLFVVPTSPIVEAVKNYWSGTPLKTCNLSQGNMISEKTPIFGTMFTKKIFDRSSGNRPKIIGLPFQAGAMPSPSGQFA